jgi:hypothetical protein
MAIKIKIWKFHSIQGKDCPDDVRQQNFAVAVLWDGQR